MIYGLEGEEDATDFKQRIVVCGLSTNVKPICLCSNSVPEEKVVEKVKGAEENLRCRNCGNCESCNKPRQVKEGDGSRTETEIKIKVGWSLK
jgi:hypothetical protein